VKEGLADSYANPVLQRSEGLDDEDVLERLGEICSIDDDLRYATRNKQSFYFSDNVRESVAGIKKNDYPSSFTRIRRRFSRQMSDASSIVKDAGKNCSVFQSPVSGQDLFARIVWCGLSGIVEGT